MSHVLYQLIAESKYNLYYATDAGIIISKSKKSGIETPLKGYLRKSRKNPTYVVKINNKEHCINSLVAAAFLPDYQQGVSNVLHKDGDKRNCAVSNLLVVPKWQVASVTGAMASSQPVIVVDSGGNATRYSSIRKAAKALYVSYQTVLDYINHRSKKSVLQGYKIILIES